MLEHYECAGYSRFPRATDYEQFARLYPCTAKSDLHDLSETLRHAGRMKSCYLVGSSGTTASPLFVANGFSVDTLRDSYSLEIRRFLGQRVFSRRDTVANLLVPGGFGCLYEGLSRLLEPIGCTVLPLGRLDAQDSPQACLDLCRQVSVNALLATPGGIVQAAHLAEQFNIVLDIRKVIYIGEALSVAKQRYINSVWPDARFYGLYGSTEMGLIGVSTPDHPDGHYDFLSKWVFAEVDRGNRLYLSDLKAPIVPVIRYDTGDLATLLPGTHRSVGTLVLHGRSDKSFNFCGNLLSLEQVCSTVWRQCGQSFALQLTLTSDEMGRDRLCVNAEFALFADPEAVCREVETGLLAIPALEEGLRRGVATIQVERAAGLWLSAREKGPLLRDLR
ncbi:hypothetical protein C4J98_3375 [Pseudomonas orientalis]|nr:hypothetical protein C4J98_3375 [Pseudomonas orientalis]